MRLGNFSVSLAVKDISASRAFYEKLGFRAIGGDQASNWLILQNETATIGLFQGMFDKNMLTFNPGWDRSAQTLPDFDDVRDIQRAFKSQGLTPIDRGRRVNDWARISDAPRSRWQPDPDRSARAQPEKVSVTLFLMEATPT